MGEPDFNSMVVRKPWGYEYLLFQNDTVAIWYLHIRHTQSTSLHCHPKKKTGLILLSGEASVSFLKDSHSLRSPGKMILRPGLFHSTKALSRAGIDLLELETPVDKDNLVRFEDQYGREGQPYEGSEEMTPIPEDFVRLHEAQEGRVDTYQIGDCVLTVEKISDLSVLKERPEQDIIALLDGAIVSAEGETIVGPGDVGSLESLLRLAAAFSAPEGITLLTICGEPKLQEQDSEVEKRDNEAIARRDAGVAVRGPRLGMLAGLTVGMSQEKTLRMFQQACLNRYFELEAAKAHKAGAIRMPIYLSLGQEHIPAAISTVTRDFMIFAQHRGHSYYLSFGGDVIKLVDELLHRKSGCAGGMGGSASIHDPEIGMVGHSGLMGDQVPIAVGAALGSGKQVLTITGDASVEEDYVYGAMGYAVTKRLPVLFLCEDNSLSILTKVETRRSWSMVDVAHGLGMAAVDITDDPWLIAHYVESYLGKLPAFINIRTCRNLWHAGTGTDGPPEWDRFELMKQELKTLGLESQAQQLENEAEKSMETIWQEQLRKP
ncbi:MAG: thiamine pyrophosphate-dependent enzyme [Acidobacteriota bacterium]